MDMSFLEKLFFSEKIIVAAAATSDWPTSLKKRLKKCNFMYLKIFFNVPKAVSVLKLSYILKILKNTIFLDKKVINMGSMSKKDILSTQYIIITLFGRGGGGLSPFGATFL